MRHLNRYLQLQKLRPLIAAAPSPDLSLCIVIPCLNETELPMLIGQLHGQILPDTAVEILIVINHADNAPDTIKTANEETLKTIKHWRADHTDPNFQVHAIRSFDLPSRDAGVGMARKTGMDEAMRRFTCIDKPAGIIISLDADCRVSKHYIAGIKSAFDRQANMHAATLPFAHRLDDVSDTRHRAAIINYELFLRYVELGWQHAGLPYAFTSIGSCFAVRANAYARHHGMNKRKAGEDFYFLHKLARERMLGYIPEVCVYPSARMSSRTPFGTGQAVSDFYHGNEDVWKVADPKLFEDLKQMRDALPYLFTTPTKAWLKDMPTELAGFLEQAGIDSAVEGMRQHTANAKTFTARFFNWFDGLKAWRYVNRQDEQISIDQAVMQLLVRRGIPCRCKDPEELLMLMRRMSQTNR